MPREAGNSIYSNLGVQPVINAAGTKTRIGGSRIRPEAAEAMREASQAFVSITDLQARASQLIQRATGAEAGYVTNGASSGLVLCAAACMAGTDVGRMDQLPDTEGIPDQIVVPRGHRMSYDHAFRTAGAEIVDVGSNDQALGTGAESVKRWEIEAAIDENTAAIGYMQKFDTEPSLETITEIAHSNDLPVIVDAAAELPPSDNLSRFIDRGADLVVFSGGKAIRGPQSSGIVAGRQQLIQSIALQHLDMHVTPELWDPPAELIDVAQVKGVPNQGIGRSMKVGKEEIVGLIRALEMFLEEDFEELQREWQESLESITAALGAIDRIEWSIDRGPNSPAPELVVSMDCENPASSALEFVRKLQNGDPPVIVGADHLSRGEFTISPICLENDDVPVLCNRLTEIFEENASAFTAPDQD